MSRPNNTFYVEDTCQSLIKPSLRGVVRRTFANVDTHEPEPQRDFDDPIHRDLDIPLAEFGSFLKSGIPPRGTVLVTWNDGFLPALVLESSLCLLDRAAYVGDVVKREEQGFMRGSITSSTTDCDLTSVLPHNPPSILRQVPARELHDAHEYHEGCLIVYNDWIGLVEDCTDEVTIRLGNNSVVVLENPDDITTRPPGTRFHVGEMVSTKKGNLRRGRWLFGEFNANVLPEGIVVQTRTVWIMVAWLCTRIGAREAVPQVPGAFPNSAEPPGELEIDILESGNVRIYRCRPPVTPNGTLYETADVKVDDYVRFNDLTGAALKYSGDDRLNDGLPRGRLTRQPRTETQGFDMNVFRVKNTVTRVQVLWQDNTVTQELTTALVPDDGYDIDEELWPGDIVHTNHQKAYSTDAAENWGFAPSQVGVIQEVRPQDRIATVRWFNDCSVKYLGNDLLPGTRLGELSPDIEEISLYDVRTSWGLSRCRGDIVLLHPGVVVKCDDDGPQSAYDIDWLGEVTDKGLDGKLGIRLAMSQVVRDITLSAEHVTLAYSHDMLHDHGDLDTSDDSQDDEGMEINGESEDFEEDYQEMWYEYPNGTVRDADEDENEGWSTEDETEIGIADGHENELAASTLPNVPDHQPKNNSILPKPASSSERTYDFSSRTHAPPAFAILDSVPPIDHQFLTHVAMVSSPQRMRRIQKEHKILRTSLPEGIFVRTWESRLDLLRVLIIGPQDTPYEFAPFLIDFHLCETFPSTAPEAFFHSWTQGHGSVNPNLYEDGKICLSLLGTWHGEEKYENWSPAKSTLLQILVSLMGLVLVKQPYYNEAGYEVRAGAEETQGAAALYSERALFRTRAFITHVLTNSILGFEEEVKWLYLDQAENGPKLLRQALDAAKDTLACSQTTDTSKSLDGIRKVSPGATIQIRRQVEAMERFMPSV